MKSWITYGLFGLISILILSCEKGHRTDCFKRTGPIEKEVRQLGNFRKLSIDDKINVTITQDTVNSVEVEAGRHLMDGILTEVNGNGRLAIKNLNKCRWARSYDKEINVHLRLKRLTNIQFTGAGNITSSDTLAFDSLEIRLNDAGGSLDLKVKSDYIIVGMATGSGDITLRGTSDITEVFSGSTGIMKLNGLKSNTVLLNNSGTGAIDVYVGQAMWASIHGDGNVYVTGPGEVKEIITTQKGQLLYR